MTFLLISSAPDAALVTDDLIVPREQVAALSTAAELLDAAGVRLKSVDRLRDSARDAAREEGFAAGFQEGLKAAAVQVTEQLVRRHRESEAERAALRATAGDLALDVVRRIAGEIGSAQMLAALTERAVRDLAPAEQIRVLVAPDLVGIIAQRLWPLEAQIEVLGEATLDPGECVIETASGRSHAGLEVQLGALAKVFAEAVEAPAHDA